MKTIQDTTQMPSARYHLLQKGGAVALSLVLASACAVPSIAYAENGDSQSSASASEQATPPEKPSGDQGDGTTPPEKPDGEDMAPGSDGNAPDGNGTAPEGMENMEKPDGEGGQPGGMGGANTQSFDYSGSYSAALTADGTEQEAADQTIEATESLQNAALAQNGGTLALSETMLKKSGDATDGDSCNFYGVNSVLLAVGEGSTATVSDCSIEATSEGSNGIFATDSATVYVRDTSITTQQDNSRGLDATYSGTIIADGMSIETQGSHCASFATDRGGGTISVADSEASTAGSGSPLVYSTGNIEVQNVTGTASGSQIAGMEGLNTIKIVDSALTSTVTGATASDPVAEGIIIYQSTSGDAETSTGEAARFEAVNSTLTSAIESGSMFFCTNTTANVVLSGTTLDFDSASCDLVQAVGNDSNNWGTAGRNGATVSFTGVGQTLSGNAKADTISTLSLYLLEGTSWTGATSIEENANGSTSEAPLTVNVDAESTWMVTESCTISALNAEEGASIVDAQGKTVSIVVDGQTVVAGESDIAVTVTGSYTTTVEVGEGQQAEGLSTDRSGLDSVAEASSDGQDSGIFAWAESAWKSFLAVFGL